MKINIVYQKKFIIYCLIQGLYVYVYTYVLYTKKMK